MGKTPREKNVSLMVENNHENPVNSGRGLTKSVEMKIIGVKGDKDRGTERMEEFFQVAE